MNTPHIRIVNLSRRQLLKSGAGLALAVALPQASVQAQEGPEDQSSMGPPVKADPQGYVRINADNSVVVLSKHLEMGQGVHTGLATMVAEELGASWKQIRVEGAPSDLKRYPNFLMGGYMGTGGQTSMQSSWLAYRSAGAAARAMIVAAAARRWNVDAGSIEIADGVVQHAPSKRKASLGAFAEDAGKLPVPTDVKLKDAKQFTYIGKRFPRVDSHAKVHGTALFTQDMKLPGMLTALVARPVRMGSKVKSFDASATLALPGVQQVVQVDSGVAVVARDFWSAKRGRDALKIEWDDSAASRHSSADLIKQLQATLEQPGNVAAKRGDADGALGKATKKITADYTVPYLTQATMEPMNVVVDLKSDSLDLWGGPQMQLMDQPTLAHVLGFTPDKIRLHMLYVGGSFGRRAQPHTQAHIEAVQIAKGLKKPAPLKVVWTREDDMSSAFSYHRPAFVHRIEAGLNDKGELVAWRHRMAGQSILTGTAMGGMVRDGVDIMSVEGGFDQPYDIPNLLADVRSPKLPVLPTWLRTTGTFHNGFAVESTIDQLAALAGVDPLEFRRRMLKNSPRALAALNLAVEKAGWSTPLAPGKAGEKRGRGMAVLPSHRSFGAAVIEVTIAADNTIQVDRVVSAMDCGTVLNPDNVLSQMQGAAAFGISSTLYNEITFADGKVEQTNFHNFPVLRMHQMPRVEAYFVASDATPNGGSETPMAPIPAALANAVANATGKRLTSIPLRLS
ncbi:MAG: twin-arginine translocation pathway signal protein [Polaromonas sp.]|nr:twin-arginine translocation pathway signal protein [Polaromonas sp.]